MSAMSAWGIEAAKLSGRGSGGDIESLVLCPPTAETAEGLGGSFSLPLGSAKATPTAAEAVAAAAEKKQFSSVQAGSTVGSAVTVDLMGT